MMINNHTNGLRDLVNPAIPESIAAHLRESPLRLADPSYRSRQASHGEIHDRAQPLVKVPADELHRIFSEARSRRQSAIVHPPGSIEPFKAHKLLKAHKLIVAQPVPDE